MVLVAWRDVGFFDGRFWYVMDFESLGVGIGV